MQKSAKQGNGLFFQMMFYIEALKLSTATNCEWKVHIPCTSPQPTLYK